jgi:DNA-directed RNA polymerase specialized sigma24 family protein
VSPGVRRPTAAGDRGGFASFFEANKDALLRFILRMGVPHADAENVNQETWLSLLNYWETRGAPEGYDDGDEQHARNLMYMTARKRIIDPKWPWTPRSTTAPTGAVPSSATGSWST